MASRLQDVILRGLAASRPAATAVAPGTLYYSTDLTTTERCSNDGTTWESYTDVGGVGPPPSSGPTPNTFLVSGGEVTWDSLYIFRVAAANYFINGTNYVSVEQTVTLDAAHATLDRIDVIALNTGGVVTKITGTPASTPSEPTTDPAAFLKLTIVLVTAATTAPPTATSELVYAENTGGPGEWNWTASAGTLNVNSTNNPRTGTKDIEGTAVAAGDHVKGIRPSGTLNPNDYNNLRLFIRSKATWNNNRGLLVTLRLAGVLKGIAVEIRRTGTFGFDSSNVASYQQIGIPTTAFAISDGTLIDEVRIEDFGGSIGFYIDDITFQVTGGSGGGAVGITQAEADARYAPLIHATRHQSGGADPLQLDNLAAPDDNTDLNASTTAHGLLRKLSNIATEFLNGQGNWATPAGAVVRKQVTIVIDGGGSVITTGQKMPVSLPHGGTWKKWRVLADVAGSIVVDLWKDTYANYPPTVADTITGSEKPTLSAVIKNEATTLSGWTTTFSAGDTLIPNVDSASTVTKVTIALEYE